MHFYWHTDVTDVSRFQNLLETQNSSLFTRGTRTWQHLTEQFAFTLSTETRSPNMLCAEEMRCHIAWRPTKSRRQFCLPKSLWKREENNPKTRAAVRPFRLLTWVELPSDVFDWWKHHGGFSQTNTPPDPKRQIRNPPRTWKQKSAHPRAQSNA